VSAPRSRTGRTPSRGGTGPTPGRARHEASSYGSTGSTGTTGSTGLTNSRTRIVGDRTGALADLFVALIRATRAIGAGAVRVSARVRDVVTPLGWATVAAVPVAAVLGYGFGWLELAVAAWVGVILAGVAVVYLVGRDSLVAELTLPHPRVVVGETATAVVAVRNRARTRTFGQFAEVPVIGRSGPDRAERVVELRVPALARDRSSSHEVSIETPRRGVLEVGPVRSVRADPVGLVRREVLWTGTQRLYVHPRTITVPATSTGLVRDLEGQPTRDLTDSDVSFHALREYSPGDERRYIHWKSTAKTGTFMVRQFEQTRRSRLLVGLSLAASDYADDDEFEMAVGAAGSLGLRAMRDAREISVVVGEPTPEFAKRRVLGIRQLDAVSRPRLLDDLAGVDRSSASLAVTDLARVAADRIAGISVAFLVCGSTPRPAELRAASVQFAAGVDVVAVVCDPSAEPGRRQVAGLSVLTIGYLDDLRISLARAAAA